MQSRNGGSKEGNFSLVAKTIKGKKFFHQKNKDKKPQDKHIDLSKIRCFNCRKMGHYARDRNKQKRKFKGKFYAFASAEEEPKKKKISGSSNDQERRGEYYLVSTLCCSIANSVESWLVDNGASRHMTGFRGALID